MKTINKKRLVIAGAFGFMAAVGANISKTQGCTEGLGIGMMVLGFGLFCFTIGLICSNDELLLGD